MLAVGPSTASQSSTDYFQDDDSQFLEALAQAVLPGDVPPPAENDVEIVEDSDEEELKPPPLAQPRSPPILKRRWSDLEEEEESQGSINRVAQEDADIYGPARFGGFGQYMHRKRAKLQIQNAAIQSQESDQGGSQIFKGLSIYINGWTQPSVQSLRELIVQHGGVYQPYLDKKSLVTHIITCSLTPAKIREFKHMKVIRPEWLVESAKVGKLLPWRDFIYVPDERPESSQGVVPRAQGSSAGTGSQASSLQPPQTPPRPAASGSEPKVSDKAAEVPKYAADASNPFAKRAMANPEWRKAHTSVAPTFIEGYYKNSRLHHLSTWKSELKDLIQEAQTRAEATPAIVNDLPSGNTLTEVSEGVSMRGAELALTSPTKAKWKGKGKAVEGSDRVIMHCDFDCFFVSAGLVSRPELKGKPVVVCHSQGNQGGASSTSEIASCSYECRTFGVRNGMSLQQARQLCPEIQTIPYEFETYKKFSLLFYTVLMSYADDLQAVSVDEALIDVTNAVAQLRSEAASQGVSVDPAKHYAESIRDAVRKATSCEISVGIAHNILLARLATRKAKPGGSYHLLPEEVAEYLAPLEIGQLHGFGYQTKKKSGEKLGTTNLGELMKKSKGQLIDAFGKATGENLYNALRGVDDRKLESDKPRKSVSCEINYGIRFETNDQAEDFIHQMAKEVKKRLDAVGVVGRSLTLKVMKRDPKAPVEPPKFLGHGKCETFSRQGTLVAPGGKATNDDQVIGDHAWSMLKSFKFDPKELRGLGIQIQKLEPANAAPQAPTGQSTLGFIKPRADNSKKGSTSASTSNAVNKAIPLLSTRPPVEDPIKPQQQATSNPFDLPSFSQVDQSVLQALPKEIRDELENEYRKRRESTPAPPPEPKLVSKPFLKPPPRVKFTGIFPDRKSKTPADLFPEKPAAQGNYKRITHQLAPKGRANISPAKSALFALLERNQKKKKPPPGPRITDAKLIELGIDPEAFSCLPRQIQDEQLVMARLIKKNGRLPTPPERKVIKPNKVTLPPGYKVWRAPPPRARYHVVPSLKQKGKSKKENLAFTDADDVQGVIERWIETYRHWPPREKDVEYFSKFVLQSVDSSVAGDDGVMTAIKVMKWWMVLLRRVWPGSELEEEGEPDGSQTDRVGQAWWDTFRDVKRQMDVVARRKFGGSLSLR
ncbi:hypothetical protein BKA70DRAFT_1088545 [Coprinopsis sp. MPI-PUGE-AT-0042]|nr:hypothetical protein BKA70DRAFT_1088545 [Coprinopsis sp. MPI-PUGE-AT-0042]